MRAPIVLPVSLEVAGAAVAVDLLNLSETGAYVRGSTEVPAGTEAVLSFSFNGSERYRASAAVVRTDSSSGFGLRFSDVNPELRGFVKLLTGAARRR